MAAKKDTKQEKKKVGKPRKFDDVEQLEKDIKIYFDNCWEETFVPVKDRNGVIKRWEQQLDKEGKPLMRLREIPCITGLANHLDTTRRTLLDYEAGVYDTENEIYSHTIKRAKSVCEYYAEQGTLNGSIAPGAGVFILKNYGWTDKQEIETSGETTVNNRVDLTAISTEDLKKMLGDTSD